MSQTWAEDLDAEFDDSEFDDAEFDDSEFDDAEFDDGEDDDGEDDDAEAARRRRRRNSRRGGRVGPRARRRAARRAPARRPRSVASAIRAVDADQRAGESQLRREINQLKKDGQWANWVTVASALVGAGLAIRKPENPWVEGAVRAVPVIAMRPARGTRGAAWLAQPPVVGAALIATTTFIGTRINQRRIDVPKGVVTASANTTLKMKIGVVSASGAPAADEVTFTSQDPTVAEFTTKNGLKAGVIGDTKITASASGVPSATFTVQVR